MNNKLNFTPHEEYQMVLVAQSNPSAFRPIYDRYYKDIFGFVYSRVADANSTAEIVSNVFFKVLTKLETFNYKGISIKSWIMKIAYNEMMSFFRQKNKNRIVSIDEEHLKTLAEETELKRPINLLDIKPFLDALSDEDLALIELKYFEKMNHKEIAEVLAISESNARVKLHRILKKLQEKAKKEVYND